jgi:ribosomal protein S18 acetylase RimI-like enzyme
MVPAPRRNLRFVTDLVGAAVTNYVEAWRLLTAALPTGAVAGDSDLVFCATGSPLALFNQTFVLSEVAPDDVLGRSREFFAAHGDVPFIVRAAAARFGPLLERAGAYGLRDGASSPLMVLHPIGVVSPPARDAEVVAVTDEDGLRAHRDVLARGFGVPPQLVDQLIHPSLVSHGWIRAFVVFVNGAPASASAFIDAGGVAGIYNVATVPEFRRRGLGETATWAAVEEAAQRGHTLITLQASEMGFPIYERMGFRVVDRWHYVTT